MGEATDFINSFQEKGKSSSTYKPKKTSKIKRISRSDSYEQRVFDYYISEAKQKKIIEESQGGSSDIMKALEIIARPFHASAGALEEAAKSILKEDESLQKTLSDVGKAVSKGIKGEEHRKLRDVVRVITPKILDKIEDKTKFKVFGIDGDLFSPVELVGGIFIDPITLIPVGSPLKALGKTLNGAGKGFRTAAGKVIGVEKVDKIFNSAIDKYVSVVGNFFDMSLWWRKAVDPKTGKRINVGHLYKQLERAVPASEQRALQLGKSVSTKVRKRGLLNFLGRSNKWIDDSDARVLSDAAHSASDEAAMATAELYAREVGMGVEEMVNFRSIEKILDEASLAGHSINEKEIVKEISEILGAQKSDVAKKVTQRLIKDRSVKGLSKSLSIAERDATVKFAETRLSAAKKTYKQAVKVIDSEINAVRKSTKRGVLLSSDMLAADINATTSSLKRVSNDLSKYLKGDMSDEVFNNIKSNIGNLKEEVKRLTKYLVEDTKYAHKYRNAQNTTLKRMDSFIVSLERQAGGDVVSGIRSTAREVMLDAKNTIHGLKREIGKFKNVTSYNLKKIGGQLKASKRLQKDIMTKNDDVINGLFDKKRALKKAYDAENAQYSLAILKAHKHQAKMANRYDKAFKVLRSSEVSHRISSRLKSKSQEILKKHADLLPEELRPSFYKIRDILDDYRGKLTSGDHPLMKGGPELYFPRMVDNGKIDFFQKLEGSIPMSGPGRGFLKKRKLPDFESYKKWAAANGMEVVEDAPVALMHYAKKADMAIAKNYIEQELMAAFNVSKRSDLPPRLLRSIDYVWNGGGKMFNEGVAGALYSGWSKMMNVARWSLTIPNPAFYGRNILGFPFLAMTRGGIKTLNPLGLVNDYANTTKLKLGMKGTIKGKHGTWSFDEFRKGAENSGYYFLSQTRGDFEIAGRMVLGRSPIYSPMRWIGEVAKFAMHTEDYGRIGAALASLRTGAAKNIDEALDLGQKAMFNYNLINSPFDKAMNGILGFYTFSRRNLPEQVQALLRDPKQYSLVARGIENISEMEKVSEEEWDAIASYDKESLKVFGEIIDGVREYKALGFFPMEEAWKSKNALMEKDVKKLLSQRSNPLASAFLSWYTGEGSLSGRPLSNQLPSRYTDVIPDDVGKFLGLEKKKVPDYRGGVQVGMKDVWTGNKTRIFMIRNMPPHTRFFNDIATLQEKISEGELKKGLTKYLTGIRSAEIDVKTSKFFKGLKEKEALKEAAKEGGAKEFKSIYAPKYEKDFPRKRKSRRKRRARSRTR